MTETQNMNIDDIFLMISKQNLDFFIELTSTMPEEIFNQLKEKMFLTLDTTALDTFKIKVFEHLPNKEFDIIATYTADELIKIIQPKF